MEKIKIPELIEMTKEEMVNIGYSENVVKKNEKIWTRFASYASQNEVLYYTEKLMMAFLEKECQIFTEPKDTCGKQEKLRALNKLDEFYKYRMISSKRPSAIKKYTFKGKIGYSVEQYIAFRKTNVSAARLQSIKLYLERFCEYVDITSSVDVHGLNAEIIQNFIVSCKIYTKSTVACTAGCLRGYLSYLYKHRLTQANLSVFVPHILVRKDSEIPSSYKAEDVEKLLNTIERNDSKGKRDYAMILIAARLGLRASDICSLTFDSIDWEKNKICIQQQKTNSQASYPLLKDVGMAIIDYLKYGRKTVSDITHIFLSELPPYHRLESGSLYYIVDFYIRRAGIHIPAGKKHGPHALRHSLSSRLLENDIPLPIISEILSHKSTETTKIYLKIAEKQLSECALAVPTLYREVVGQ